MIPFVAAVAVTVLFGMLVAYGTRSSCFEANVEVTCPTDPVGPEGKPVSDKFAFAHRSMGENGSITVRLAAMTGTITYPPPDHDEIVSGLVPWAKAGIIVKDGTRQGSSYAALMLTGQHGVRMQYDYTHDIAGAAVPPSAPRWLRLVRAGKTITGYESSDGQQWTEVGAARLDALPTTVAVGLFATSPGDLTLHRVALGGAIEQSRFTQAVGVFDHVTVDGGSGGWRDGTVGEMGHTDWEKYHRASGVVRSGDTVEVSGTGDIGPVGTEGGRDVEDVLIGLPIGLLIVVVVAARRGRRAILPAFGTGLVAAGITVPLGAAVLGANGVGVHPVSVLTGVRVVVGVAVLFALAAGFVIGLRALLRRTWLAVLVGIATVVVPYLLAALPLLPDGVSDWLLRITPAAGFAVLQTVREYPQVLAHYAPSAGYFPLPWWAGLAVLFGFAAAALTPKIKAL
ncbi:hypothetical protein WEI85_14980 [Actinomycetes bacterium KLBMP 9797]